MSRRLAHSLMALSLLMLLPMMAQAQQKAGKRSKKTESAVNNPSTAGSDLKATSIAEMYINAERDKMLNNFAEAIKGFESVLHYDPENHAAHYELANLYLAAGQIDEALPHAKAAYKANPDNKWYAYTYANALTARAQYSDAADLYAKILAANPSDMDSYPVWANLLLKANRPEDAIDVWNKYERISGLDEKITQEKMRIYMALNKPEAAAAEIRKLTDADPNNMEYVQMLSAYYMNNHQPDQAAILWHNVLLKDSANPYALTFLATDAETKGDTAAYMKYMEQAYLSPMMKVDDKIKILYAYLRDFDNHRHQQWQALILAKDLCIAHPDEAKAFAIAGDLYYANDSLADALKAYQRSLELRQDVYTVWDQCFGILANQMQWAQLQMLTEKALDLYPNEGRVYMYHGIAQSHQGQYAGAVDDFQAALKRSSSDKEMKNRLFTELGDAWHYLKRDAVSDSCFEQALLLNPTDAYSLNNYAYYLALRKEKLDKAALMSKKSNELNPSNASFLDTYAYILFVQGNYSEAQTWQQKAIDAEKDTDAVLYEHMGDILFKSGQSEQAMKMWRLAASKDSNNALLKKKIDSQNYIEE